MSGNGVLIQGEDIVTGEKVAFKLTEFGGSLTSSVSINALTGGQSEKVTISSTSAQTAVINSTIATVTPSVDCFFRKGANPTALADGTDQILLGGNTYRIGGLVSGEKLAFIAVGSGSVYVTPGG